MHIFLLKQNGNEFEFIVTETSLLDEFCYAFTLVCKEGTEIDDFATMYRIHNTVVRVKERFLRPVSEFVAEMPHAAEAIMLDAGYFVDLRHYIQATLRPLLGAGMRDEHLAFHGFGSHPHLKLVTLNGETLQ